VAYSAWANSPPHDVGLTFDQLIAVFERGPTVNRPGHLEDARCPLNSSHSQIFAERAPSLQVLDELVHGNQDRRLLRWGELLEVSPEPC
jgi:hypothetical protein